MGLRTSLWCLLAGSRNQDTRGSALRRELSSRPEFSSCSRMSPERVASAILRTKPIHRLEVVHPALAPQSSPSRRFSVFCLFRHHFLLIETPTARKKAPGVAPSRLTYIRLLSFSVLCKNEILTQLLCSTLHRPT
ncbi:hypothetical protein B0H12DRAFT_1123145 [Mycena haematopus]|nr:hypothetical protein B0H12DRAFT_1123145 [Mycena haematopus]